MCESIRKAERDNDPRHRSHRPCGARRRLQLGITRPRRGRNGPGRPSRKQAPAILNHAARCGLDASALKRAPAASMIWSSSDGDASAVMRHHANAIEAATATNIRHITFTSIVDTDELSPFYFSPFYGEAERQLAVRGVPCIIYMITGRGELGFGKIAEGRDSQVSKDFTAITGREPESFRDFLLRATSRSPADCIAGSPLRKRHRSEILLLSADA
jgi:hypothetical protein